MDKKLAHLDAKNGYLESEAGLLRKEVTQLEEQKHKNRWRDLRLAPLMPCARSSSDAAAAEESKASDKPAPSLFPFEIPGAPCPLHPPPSIFVRLEPILSSLTHFHQMFSSSRRSTVKSGKILLSSAT